MDSISNNEAKRLLEKALKHLSAKYKTDLKLYTDFANGVSITYPHGEIASITSLNPHTVIVRASPTILLCTLLTPATILQFEINDDWEFIDFSKEFGTTVEELKVKLDLLNI